MAKHKTHAAKYLLVILATIALAAIALFSYHYSKKQDPTDPINDPNNCKPGHQCVVIEDQGKIKVAERPEVMALAEKYDWEHVHISALDIKLVEDIDFISQINPRFKKETGCIIVVHAGNEGFVYQENESLEVIYQETLSEFLENTKHVPPEIMSKFYLSLH